VEKLASLAINNKEGLSFAKTSGTIKLDCQDRANGEGEDCNKILLM
jgi:hypothetical protein